MKNKNLFILALLSFLFTVSFTESIHAQSNLESNGLELLQPATENTPLTFDYDKTPKIAYGKNGRNPFAHFTPEQLATLNSYAYPQFISHGTHLIEQDILAFKAARKAWDNANAYRKDEIYLALGITK